jgi:hypothetical protein
VRDFFNEKLPGTSLNNKQGIIKATGDVVTGEKEKFIEWIKNFR